MHWIELLRCPFCASAFLQKERTLSCEQGHSFDLAREGYVNLLRKKPAAQVGDTKEMLMARRSFLEEGHYQALSEQLGQIVSDYAQQRNPAAALTLLDAGCGEGYYLGRLHKQLEQANIHVDCLGLDISKEAIRMAARKDPTCSFVVASIKERFVIADGAIQILTNIFAPRNPTEFARVLAPNGLLLVVIPGPDHLLSLREELRLLSIEDNKQQNVTKQLAEHFTFCEAYTTSYQLHLNQEEIRQLVMMTPNRWHASDELQTTLAKIDRRETQATFTCLCFKLHK